MHRLATAPAASHGVSRHSMDSDRQMYGDMGSAKPVRRSPPFGPSIQRPSNQPKPARGPPCAFAPLQRSPSRIRTAIRRFDDLRRHSNSRLMLPLMDFDHPSAHSGMVDPLHWRRVPSPPRPAFGVWLPPSRTTPSGLSTSDAFQRHMPASTSSVLERPWAFPYKGFPSTAIEAPFGVLCPPVVTPRVCRLPEGFRFRRKAVFRALIPRRVRSDTVVSGGKPPTTPVADPFLGFRLSRA
jgi:hypothetical protein